MATEENQQRFKCCYHIWVSQQHLDLDEMRQTLAQTPDNQQLNLLIQKSINHFQEYLDSRAVLAQHDTPSFLSPSWGNTFSNSFLWIGGCRPSLAIRLIYSLSGSHVEANLDAILARVAAGEEITHGNLGDLSANQLILIDALHRKTVKDEDLLSSRFATLQEDLADVPVAIIAKRCKEIGESNEEVDKAMDAHAHSLCNVLIAADKLRLNTLKDVMHILTPLQGVELLLVSKKLHLSLYAWGKRRDQRMGINLQNQQLMPTTSSGSPATPTTNNYY